MVPTVALLNVEVEGITHCVACRGLVARARQVALAIARSKLKRDARRCGVAQIHAVSWPMPSKVWSELRSVLSSAPGLLEYVHSS